MSHSLLNDGHTLTYSPLLLPVLLYHLHWHLNYTYQSSPANSPCPSTQDQWAPLSTIHHLTITDHPPRFWKRANSKNMVASHSVHAWSSTSPMSFCSWAIEEFVAAGDFWCTNSLCGHGKLTFRLCLVMKNWVDTCCLQTGKRETSLNPRLPPVPQTIPSHAWCPLHPSCHIPIYTDAYEDAECLFSFTDSSDPSADGDEWVETHAGRQAHRADSATNAGEIGDIPDLDGNGLHDDEERITKVLGGCHWVGEEELRGLGRWRRLTWMISPIWWHLWKVDQYFSKGRNVATQWNSSIHTKFHVQLPGWGPQLDDRAAWRLRVTVSSLGPWTFTTDASWWGLTRVLTGAPEHPPCSWASLTYAQFSTKYYLKWRPFNKTEKNTDASKGHTLKNRLIFDFMHLQANDCNLGLMHYAGWLKQKNGH